MNDEVKKICEIYDRKERLRKIDDLLSRHKVFLNDIMDYYTSNVSSKTIDFAVYYLDRGINIRRIEDAVASSGDLFCMFLFAKNIEVSNIDRFTDITIASRNNWYIFLYARNIKGVNIAKLEDATIESLDGPSIYSFAKNVKGANVVKLHDGMLKTGDREYMYYFDRDIMGYSQDILMRDYGSLFEDDKNNVKVKEKRI